MGWGATAKMKRIVCASATRLEAELAESEVVIFDMNAIGRQHFNYPANVSPRGGGSSVLEGAGGVSIRDPALWISL